MALFMEAMELCPRLVWLSERRPFGQVMITLPPPACINVFQIFHDSLSTRKLGIMKFCRVSSF